MSSKLFLNTVECVGGRMLLGFAVGTPVLLADGEKVRDLSGGLAEYAMTVSGGGGQFNVRIVADDEGMVREVVASSEPIPDDWYEALMNPSEE